MSDIFSLKSVPLTPELGMVLKNFRIENNITAKSITEKFNKASSYISKLEKGNIKKIDGDFLISLCNYISGTNNGIVDFMAKISPNFISYSAETKLIAMNIDDLLLEHTIPDAFINETKEYLESHNISITELAQKINSNEDIIKLPIYDSLPENQWYAPNGDIDNAVIKLCIPQLYIEDLFNSNINTIHRVIAEAILYALYKLGNEENAHLLAHNKLDLYNIIPRRNVIRVTPDNIDNVLGALEPDAADALKSVTSDLKFITTITKGYGSKRIKQISKNMNEDMGFFFAFMSLDIVELENKDKKIKQQFLSEVKELIEKYSTEDKPEIDLYEL